jgi:hypothetical protein
VVSGSDRCEVVDEPVRLGRRPTLPATFGGRGRMLVVGAADPAVSRNALDLRVAVDGWELHNPSSSSPLSLVASTTGELQLAPGAGLRLGAGASIVLIPGAFGPYRVMLHHHVEVVAGGNGARSRADGVVDGDGGDTTLGFTPPDPTLRLWLAARFGSYVKPDIDRPSARSAQASYPVFSAACGTAASFKGLMRREEKLRESLDQIIGGVAGRENTHRFANELVQRGLLTCADLESLHRLLDRKGGAAEGG